MLVSQQLAGPICDLPMSDESWGGESHTACVMQGEQAVVFDVNIPSNCSRPGIVVATELPGFDKSSGRFLQPGRRQLTSSSHTSCTAHMRVLGRKNSL